MKKRMFICLLVIMVFTTLLFGADVKKAPAFNAEEWLNVEKFDVDNVLGKKIIVLQFWKTWDPLCAKSIPVLNDIAQKYSDKDLTVITLTKEKSSLAQKILEKQKIDFIIGTKSQSADDYKIEKVPYAFLIDLNKNIIWAGHPLDGLKEKVEEIMKNQTSKKEENIYALMKTSYGDIKIELFPKEAPKTVENFVQLAKGEKEFVDPWTGKKTKRPFYNGLTFHRVIDNFMIQGGCPRGDGRGGPGYKFADEFSSRKFSKPGILAMANAGPNTNGSQFFITLVPTPWLDGKHTIFGEVVDGMNVVKKIGKAKVGRGSKPVIPIFIKSVEIINE